jgi:hypothetical protein
MRIIAPVAMLFCPSSPIARLTFRLPNVGFDAMESEDAGVFSPLGFYGEIELAPPSKLHREERALVVCGSCSMYVWGSEIRFSRGYITAMHSLDPKAVYYCLWGSATTTGAR